jgi:hypothetical protein
MDWTKQTEELIKTWTDAQQKMWDSWLGAMRSQGGGASQVAGAWEKSVEAWRQAVDRALAAQVTWTRMWADQTTTSTHIPEEMAGWSRQVVDVMQRWTETQKSLWERWFEMLKNTSPSTLASTWANEAQKVSQAWEEAAKQSLEAQQEWTRRATAAQPHKKTQ